MNKLDGNVDHPSHYNSGSIECIDAIKAQMTHDEYLGFLRGNVAKYMWRWRDKGGVESLHKAQWYLSRMIEEAQTGETEDETEQKPKVARPKLSYAEVAAQQVKPNSWEGDVYDAD